MARDDPHFCIRLPEELHDKVRLTAALNRRSITAEIVPRLGASFSTEAVYGDLLIDAELMAAMRIAAVGTIERLLTEPGYHQRIADLAKREELRPGAHVSGGGSPM